MKLYRAVPNSFYMKDILKGTKNDRHIFEDVYYRMGYIPIRQHINHNYNTIYRKLNDQEKCGKYFFLFLEDAIWNGLSLLQSFHNIHGSITFIILEYEVPDDLVLKHIGNGSYTSDAFPNLIMECFITKDDIYGNKSSSINISNEEKENGLIKAFENGLKSIEGNKYELYSQYLFDQQFFNIDDLSEVINNPNMAVKKLINSPLYNDYMNKNNEIIKTPFITGKLTYVYYSDDYDQLVEKLEPLNKRFNDFDDQYQFKNELLHYSSIDSDDAKEKVKKLLKERHYM